MHETLRIYQRGLLVSWHTGVQFDTVLFVNLILMNSFLVLVLHLLKTMRSVLYNILVLPDQFTIKTHGHTEVTVHTEALVPFFIFNIECPINTMALQTLNISWPSPL